MADDVKDPPTGEYIEFDGRTPGEIVYVRRRCPGCGSYISRGRLFLNTSGAVKLTDWICRRCGPITPLWSYEP